MLTSPANTASADHTTERHRHAYNAAFYELGLKWHWDAETYQALLHKKCEKERIRFYLENHRPHLLKAYDAEFLVSAIQSSKARCEANMGDCSERDTALINWAELHAHEIGV